MKISLKANKSRKKTRPGTGKKLIQDQKTIYRLTQPLSRSNNFQQVLPIVHLQAVDNILYYPSINLPKAPWVIQSVLYWDQISTIVPYEFTQNPDLLEKDMRELVTAGAVKQEPTTFYGQQQYEASRIVFTMLLQNQHTFPDLRSNAEKGKLWEIHKEKFFDELFDNLLAWGLAKKHHKQNWYWVEQSVAACMMTTLATLIGDVTKSIPSTDDVEFIPQGNIFLPGNTDAEHFRGRILNDVIPYPENFEIDDLVRFKDKYPDELRDFRRLIEKNVLQLRGIDSKELQEKTLQLQVAEITDRSDELVARLKENKFGKITLSTVKGAVIDAAIAVVTGDVLTPTASILKGIIEIRKQYHTNPVRDEDLAYIALLKKKNG